MLVECPDWQMGMTKQNKALSANASLASISVTNAAFPKLRRALHLAVAPLSTPGSKVAA